MAQRFAKMVEECSDQIEAAYLTAKWSLILGLVLFVGAVALGII